MMAIYVIVSLFVVIVFLNIVRRRYVADLESALTGKWYCCYQHPYVWADKKCDELPFQAEYVVSLFQDGTGLVYGIDGASLPDQKVYFSWVYENDYIVVDSEKWDNSAPVYLRLLHFGGDSGKLEVFYLEEAERMPFQRTFAVRLRQPASYVK